MEQYFLDFPRDTPQANYKDVRKSTINAWVSQSLSAMAVKVIEGFSPSLVCT
jgi:hypothetical protein